MLNDPLLGTNFGYILYLKKCIKKLLMLLLDRIMKEFKIPNVDIIKKNSRFIQRNICDLIGSKRIKVLPSITLNLPNNENIKLTLPRPIIFQTII